MAVITRDEFMAGLKSIIGDNSSDEALAFLDDATDTLGDYEARLSDGTDWKAKYEENDANWRNRYKERFFSESPDEPSGAYAGPGYESNAGVAEQEGQEVERDYTVNLENLFGE